ncbi:hypothetical protein FLW53_39050 [Microbispora sp. SCL1-1]|nr:hypothetical protein FLW53_39050 [Microbispora sp. SCL1-1]
MLQNGQHAAGYSGGPGVRRPAPAHVPPITTPRSRPPDHDPASDPAPSPHPNPGSRPRPTPDGLQGAAEPAKRQGVLDGLRAAGPVRSVGVDSWAVDYGLLDGDGRLPGLHHRPVRRPRPRLVARPGIPAGLPPGICRRCASPGHPPVRSGPRSHPRPRPPQRTASGLPAPGRGKRLGPRRVPPAHSLVGRHQRTRPTPPSAPALPSRTKG